MSTAVTMPREVEVNGRTWSLYAAEYAGADGTFGLHFYAISMEHAAIVVEDIKTTLKLTGKYEGTVRP